MRDETAMKTKKKVSGKRSRLLWAIAALTVMTVISVVAISGCALFSKHQNDDGTPKVTSSDDGGAGSSEKQFGYASNGGYFSAH